MNFVLTSELKEKWCQALESGKYQQGQHSLSAYQGLSDNIVYCCLGVLGEEANFKSAGISHLCSGTEHEPEFLDLETQRMLMTMNDGINDESKVFSFKEIAAWVRENVPSQSPTG